MWQLACYLGGSRSDTIIRLLSFLLLRQFEIESPIFACMTEMVWAYFGEIGNMHGNWRLPFASNRTNESSGPRDEMLSSFLEARDVSGDKLSRLKRGSEVQLNARTHLFG